MSQGMSITGNGILGSLVDEQGANVMASVQRHRKRLATERPDHASISSMTPATSFTQNGRPRTLPRDTTSTR